LTHTVDYLFVLARCVCIVASGTPDRIISASESEEPGGGTASHMFRSVQNGNSNNIREYTHILTWRQFVKLRKKENKKSS